MSVDEQNILYGGDMISIADYMGNNQSFGELFLNTLNEIGNAVVLVDGLTSEEITGFQLRDRSIRLAECLQYHGVKAGDKIGIYSENRIEFTYVLLGTLYLGATCVPMNCTYTKDELKHAISLTKPTFIFVSPIVVDKILNIAKQSSFVQQVVVFDDKRGDKNTNDYSRYIQNANIQSSKNFKCPPQDIYKTIALIFFSSGTTGLPKGVLLPQSNIISAILQFFICPTNISYLKPENVFLNFLPWFHIYGCNFLIGLIFNRSKAVFLPKFQDIDFLRCIEKYKINISSLVPPLMIFLAKSPLVDQYDLSSLKALICGAAPLSKELKHAVIDRIKVPFVRQAYGMTEGTLNFCSQNDDRNKASSVGVINLGMWAKVVDIDTRRNLGPNEEGELMFKGATIMKGYIDNDEATRNAIDKDGWLRTGDIAYYDKDGEIFIVDRLKELIKYKAYQVPPAEIEAVLLQNTKILDAGVVGLPDEEAGELPIAFVVKRDNQNITTEEIIHFVAEKLSPAKHIRGGVRFLNAIPRNASGKILRKELRQLLQNTKSKL